MRNIEQILLSSAAHYGRSAVSISSLANGDEAASVGGLLGALVGLSLRLLLNHGLASAQQITDRRIAVLGPFRRQHISSCTNRELGEHRQAFSPRSRRARATA
jgi:hypothetical protein